MIRSNDSCSSADSKLAFPFVRWISQTTPSASSRWRTSSASRGLSSRCSTRSGRVTRISLAADHPRHFVDDCPEHADLLHGVDEILKLQRLDHVGVDAELVAVDEILLLPRRGHHYDRDRLERRIALDLTQDLQSVHLRQFQVEEHHGRLIVRPCRELTPPIQIVQCFCSVPNVHDFIGELVGAEGVQDQLRVALTVLDKENPLQRMHKWLS